ncbi:MAG: hypothetical protein ACXVHS_11230 [Methanobacterium sp.]
MENQAPVTDDKIKAKETPTDPAQAGEDESEVEDKGKEDPMLSPHRLFIGGGLILTGFVFSILLVYWLQSLFSLGISGIAIFFVVLIGADIFSGTTRLNTGEIRKAVTISFIAVYFLWFGLLSNNAMNSAFMAPILDNYWKLIAVIIGFYFGGRSAEEIAKKVTADNKDQSKEAGSPEEIITKIRQILKI